MKPINVRFEKLSVDMIDSISAEHGKSKSDIARTAMNLGLREMIKKDSRQINGLVHINQLRAMFNDDDAMNDYLEEKFNKEGGL
jgi:hypothetical protein